MEFIPESTAMKKLLAVLALALPLAAHPCLNGQGPLQEGQVPCVIDVFDNRIPTPSTIYFSDTNLFSPSWLSLVQGSVGRDTYLQISADGELPQASVCESAQGCALIRIMHDGKEVARLNMNAEWWVDPEVDHKLIAKIIAQAFSGGLR